MMLTPPVLMVVTDPEIPDLEARVADAIRGGAALIQYRHKEGNTEERIAWIRAFRDRHPETPVVVNNDLMAASDAPASGLHMSSGYECLSDARALLGRLALIGRSVHTGYSAPEASLDYVTFGTVFPSSTHPGGPVAGLEGLRQACEARPELPVLAIGGISAATAGRCIEAGAAGVAVIRSVLEAPDPAQAAADIIAAMREAI